MSRANKISADVVKRIADLAKLPIKDEDLPVVQKELSNILDLFDKLNEINTKGVIPTSQVTGLENVFREDKVNPSLPQESVLSNAKKTYNGYFVVEAIFD